MLVNVITALSRAENSSRVWESITDNQPKEVSVEWHVEPDADRRHVGGQHPKNVMLQRIKTGWVCILDDDTVMHPKFLRRVYRAHMQNPHAPAIVVSQKRTTGVVLQAKPENMVVGKVDAGQVVLRRSLIGDLLIPETYAGDGEWIECLLYGREDVVYLSEVLSLHNALSGVDVSETPERMGA